MKLKDLEKRLKQEPTNLGLRVQVAGMMREAGRSLEAVEIYRSVALAYRDQGRTQQAIAVCRSILDIAPEDSACQGLLAMLQARNAPPKPVTPPPEATPGAAETLPRPGTATMRGSSMAPAPEVPSLRATTSQAVGRSAPTGQHRPVSPTGSHRPASATAQPRSVSPTGTQRPVSPTAAQRPVSPTGAQRPVSPTGAQRPAAAPQRPVAPMAAAPQRSIAPTSPPQQRPVSPTSPQQRPAAPVSPTRQITRPVPQHDPRAMEPGRRSSFESTPLPQPLPYHLADRTSQPSRVSSGDIDLDDATRVDPSPTGLAQAARRISGLISDSRGVPSELDMSAELVTRERPRIDPVELDKVAAPPPTVPVPLERLDELDDMTTPPPGDLDDMLLHRSSDALTPPPRGGDDLHGRASRPSDDSLGRPSRPSMPRIGPPRTSSRPPAVVSIPPKTSSRPPGSMTAPPAAKRPTPSVPPMPSRPAPSVPPPAGSPVAKLRPLAAPSGPSARPAMPKIPRDSESELTRPRDRGAPDDDDDD